MKFKSILIINVITNLVMALAMSITADLINATLSIRTLLMFAIGFTVGMIVSLIIPLGKISIFINKKLNVKEKSLAWVLVGNIVPSIIMTTILTFVMTLVNVGFSNILFIAFLSMLPIMLLIGYIVICIVNTILMKLIAKL